MTACPNPLAIPNDSDLIRASLIIAVAANCRAVSRTGSTPEFKDRSLCKLLSGMLP